MKISGADHASKHGPSVYFLYMTRTPGPVLQAVRSR